jgi:hypothetical protein
MSPERFVKGESERTKGLRSRAIFHFFTTMSLAEEIVAECYCAKPTCRSNSWNRGSSRSGS